MGKFDLYKVELKNLSPGVHEYEYFLENKFFVDIDGDEVQKGKVKVNLTVKRTSMVFDMNFQLEGIVYVPCDRCLDDMELPVSTQNKLVVKFGKEYAEKSEEIVIIPEEEGEINLAWFIYEFIALAIPMKHIHAPGKCNKGMMGALNKHLRTSADEEDEMDDFLDEEEMTDEPSEAREIDPRWNELKKILDNN